MTNPNDSSNPAAALSAAKRLLLERRLQGLAADSREDERPRRAGTGPAALSSGQQRLWFLHRLAPESAAYTMYQAVRLRGALDQGALEGSLREVVRRHEALRTTFEVVDGRPVQVVAPPGALALPVVALDDLSEAERAGRARELAEAEIRRPFDLERGPLLRLLLVRLAEADHVLVVAMHHIVSDEWSLDVFWREVAALYAAGRAGRPSPLEEPRLQYVDYAHWQQVRLEDEATARQLAYWKGRLAGDLPALQLPFDRPPQAADAPDAGGIASRRLSPELGASLRRLCREEGVTLFMLVLAAYEALLHRYTGQTDFTVGVPVTTRGRAELEGLVGFFLNTLVLRADLSGEPTFRELLRRTRGAVLGGFAHQELPFERLVQELHPERQAGQNPLFQVMFVHQREAALPAWGPELRSEIFPIEARAAKFDLTLFLGEGDPHLTLSAEYAARRFGRQTAERLLGHLEVLLGGIAANPDERVARLPLLASEERATLLSAWSTTAAPEPAEACIHHLIEAQAARTPAADALRYEDRRLSYRELDEEAERVAARLRRRGVGPGVCVGLCVERSPEMLVGVLGILKAGGAYVPLDPSYPAERLRFMLTDSGAPVLLAGERPAWLGPGSEVEILTFAEEADPEPSASAPARAVTPDDVAYVIYTSGSTGLPKGVPVPHRNLVHSTRARLRHYPERVDGFLLLSSFAFDSSVAGIFWTLVTGGALVLPRPREEQDVAALAALVARHRVTHTLCLPSLYGLLLTYADPRQLASLRAVVVAGEACPSAVARRHEALLPGAALYNEYGPTEATVWSTVHRVSSGDASSTVPIGRPIAGADIYLLDDHRQPVPAGVPGELYIGGAGVVRGYLDRPELTAERFLPHPFRAEPGARLYRTGDLARFREDGVLEFVGRADRQVKLRGYRIEPGEIEAALQQHPAVREAVVTVPGTRPGAAPPDGEVADRALVAYVVSVDPDAAPDGAELRRFLKERLPAPLVPSAFVPLDDLPRTPGGKVDLRALPAPASPAAERDASYAAPQNPVEEALAGIWAAVLGLERVGVRDNFFEIGGDSILSIQIIAKARQAGLQLAPAQLFRHQTIAELAAVAGVTRPAAVRQEPETGAMPLTPIQHWFFEQQHPEPQHWHHALWLEEPAGGDAERFEAALGHVVRHHDALRLRFVREASGWQSHYAPPETPVPVRHVDLSALPERQQAAALDGAAASLFSGLDLAEGLPIQAARFRTGDDRPARLLLGVHHLVVDLLSWRIVVEDLEAVYARIGRGEAPVLPPRTTSFRTWSEALGRYAASPALQAEHGFWLAQSGAASLPTDFDGAFTEAMAATCVLSLGADETRSLHQEALAPYNLRAEEVLLTALVQVFEEWTGRPELFVSLERHGREEIVEGLDLSRTVGWFTASFPLLLRGGRPGPGEALKAVKEQMRRIPGGGVGYGVLRYLGPDEALRQRLRTVPEPAVVFNYAGRAGSPAAAGGSFRPLRTLEASRSPRNRRGHLLEVNAFVEDERLKLHWSYSTSVYRRETVERLAGSHLDALRRLVAHCLSCEAAGYTPSDFPEAGLSQAELDQFMSRLFS